MHEILSSAPELKVAMFSNDFKELRETLEIYVPILECFLLWNTAYTLYFIPIFLYFYSFY
jgi:hypothetical protein